MSKIPNEVREQLNEKISQGYQLAQSNNEVAASEMWLAAWEMVMEAMDKYDIENLEAFDRDFKGKELIYNLASDLELELDKAASADPSYWEKRIKFCSQYIERYGDQSDYNIMNMRRSIAESYYFMGLSAEGERHFRQIIADYPFWSWGWIGYSDMYWLFGLEKDKDSAKAESILLKALEEKELDEHEEVQQRLKELYLELGRKKDAEDIVIERENYIAPSQQKVIQQSPVKVEKIGRNEPCPCGSGKKYKKCCGAN